MSDWNYFGKDRRSTVTDIAENMELGFPEGSIVNLFQDERKERDMEDTDLYFNWTEIKEVVPCERDAEEFVQGFFILLHQLEMRFGGDIDEFQRTLEEEGSPAQKTEDLPVVRWLNDKFTRDPELKTKIERWVHEVPPGERGLHLMEDVEDWGSPGG